MTDTQKLDIALLKLDKVIAALEAMNRTTATTPVGEFGGTGPAKATKAEVADNPGKYYGTKSDPLASDVVIPRMTIVNFETKPDVFIGGTATAWFKTDPAAMLAWFRSTHDGHDLNFENLHVEQKKLLGLM